MYGRKERIEWKLAPELVAVVVPEARLEECNRGSMRVVGLVGRVDGLADEAINNGGHVGGILGIVKSRRSKFQ